MSGKSAVVVDFSHLSEGKKGEIGILWGKMDTLVESAEITDALALALRRAGIRYLGELVLCTRKECYKKLRQVAGINPRSAKRVVAACSEFLAGVGLSWGMSWEEETFHWLPPEKRNFVWGST